MPADWSDAALLEPILQQLSVRAERDAAAWVLMCQIAQLCRAWRAAAHEQRSQQTTITVLGSARILEATGQLCRNLHRITVIGCSASDDALMALFTRCSHLSQLHIHSYREDRFGDQGPSHTNNLVQKLTTMRDCDISLPTMDIQVAASNATLTSCPSYLFPMEWNSPMTSLLHHFCARYGLHEPSDIHIFFDGERVRTTQTPLELEMVGGDVVDVMVASSAHLHNL